MSSLVERQEDQERRLIQVAAELRFQLLEVQDELKYQEEIVAFEREKRRDKWKEMQSEITRLEEIIRNFDEKKPGVEYPALKSAQKKKKILESQCKDLEEEERQLFVNLRDGKRNTRLKAIRAEEQLRLNEARQARQREDFAAQRERLQARLQRLEDKALGLEPADRLRDVERKLDALRREVGELRRVIEKEKQR